MAGPPGRGDHGGRITGRTGQQKHRARFTRGELTLVLGDPTVPINRQPSTTLNLKLRVRVFDSLEIAGNARPMRWGCTSAGR